MRFLVAAVLVLASCSSASDEEPAIQTGSSQPSDSTQTTFESTPTGEQLFPDVVAAVATEDEPGLWSFSVTLSSPYDSRERYADSWRVRAADGTVYGERFLSHDHANEQPFTRSQSGIEIPENIDQVIIEGRDQLSGWGGTTLTLTLDRP
jgi:hypothetical protein